MEGIIKIKTPQEGFVKHVFDFGDDSKSEVMNSIQYLAVSFIPVLLASHVLNKLFKEVGSGNNNVKTEETSSVQLLAEVLIQLFLSIVILFFINRFATYFPTYSGVPFTELNMINLVFMLLPLPINSGGSIIGEKLSVLLKRFDTVVFGQEKQVNNQKKIQSNVKVSQPISGQMPRTQPTHQVSRADYTQQHGLQQPPQSALLGTSNQIYGGPENQMVDAEFGNTGGQEGFNNMVAPPMEPAAANGVLGGSFGSAF